MEWVVLYLGLRILLLQLESDNFIDLIARLCFIEARITRATHVQNEVYVPRSFNTPIYRLSQN